MTRRMQGATLLLLAAALLLAACGGLGGEPVIVSTLGPAATTVADQGFPDAPPDMANGAAIFAARCTECHGVTGAGDGERVQNGQIANVPNFLDPAIPSPQRVSEWYTTITNGRIENLMPPWRNALSEQERWDVAYYTYTLHAAPEQLGRGADVFAENCVRCHGDQGRGDGPDAADLSGSVGDLTDQANMASLSNDAIFTTVTEGVGERGDGMPGFGDELSETDRWAVTQFVRTLALTNAVVLVTPEATPAAGAALPTVAATLPPAQPTAASAETTAEATVEPAVTSAAVAGETLTVGGTIFNGTPDAMVPEGLEVSLFVFPQDADPIQLDTLSGPGGAYSFADVPFLADGAYATTVTHSGRLFLSDIVAGAQLTAEPVLDVFIYEITADPSVLTISLIETQINVTDEALEVAQFIEVTNSSDRAFSTDETAPDGRFVSLQIPLPPGSIVPGFNQSGRYSYLSEDFVVLDSQPVYPGVIHLVQLVYIIPYTTDSAIIEQPIRYAFNGLDQLLVRPTSGITVTADGLASMGTTTVGTREFLSLSGTRVLPAGSVRRIELAGSGAGSPSSFAADTPVVSGDLAPLLLIGGAALIAVVVVLFIWSRRRGSSGALPPVSPELLAREIAELDAAHAAGEIPDETYKRQRAALKTRLTRLLIGDDE